MADVLEQLPLVVPVKPLYEMLMCPICEDVVDKAVVTPCGHVYCEVCGDGD